VNPHNANPFGGNFGEEWLRLDFAALGAYFSRNTIDSTAGDADDVRDTQVCRILCAPTAIGP
jgi:hypothetical protein